MDEHTIEKLRVLGIDEERISTKNLSELDLSGANLSGLDLRGFSVCKTNFEKTVFTSSDLRCLDFASANCVSGVFIGTDLRGANLAFGYFTNANFCGADLRGVRLSDALCAEADFTGADLRGARLGREHLDADFRGADLRGITVPEEGDFTLLNCDIRGTLRTPHKRAAVTNKRIAHRTRLDLKIPVIDSRSSDMLGILRDVTAQGMRLSGATPFIVGNPYALKFTLPGQSEPVECKAKCVWCNPGTDDTGFQAGFRIRSIEERGLVLLRTFITEGAEEQNQILRT